MFYILSHVLLALARPPRPPMGGRLRLARACLSHSLAPHLLQSGTAMRTVQDLMGHTSVETTTIFLHVMKRPGTGGPRPLELA
jgi:hypothetical protein